MLKCVAGAEKLRGKTIVLVDVSRSGTAPLSHRSEMQRTDVAYGLAVLLARDRREQRRDVGYGKWTHIDGWSGVGR